MADKEIANKFDPSIELAFQPDDNECPPSHAISQPGKIPVSECLPSHDISQPGKIPGGVSSSRTEPEADNEPLKQLLEGNEYGGARLKYRKPRVVTKSDADDQSETSSSNGLDSEAHSERSSVSSLSDVNFEKDSHKPKKLQVEPTMRTPRAEEDVEQTMRTPCATEDSSHHEDTKSALAEPDLRDKGETTSTEQQTVPIAEFQMVHPRQQNIVARLKDLGATARLPDDQQIIEEPEQNIEVGQTENFSIIVDLCSTPKQPVDHIPGVQQLVSNLNTKLKYLLFLCSSDKKILKEMECILGNVGTGSFTFCTKRYAPALLAAYLSNYEFDNFNSLMKTHIVTSRRTMGLLLPLLNPEFYDFKLWNDNLTTQRAFEQDLIPYKTQPILSDFPDILDNQFDVYIDGDNCVRSVKQFLVGPSFTFKCVVYGNKQTMDLLSKFKDETNTGNHIVLARPSSDLHDSADCDIVKHAVYNYRSNPRPISIVSGDKIFKFTFKTNNLLTESLPDIISDVLVLDPQKNSPQQLISKIYDHKMKENH